MTAADQSLPPLFATLPVAMGSYTLTHRLGSQVESESYIARQSHVERHVVLEILRPATGAEGITRFRNLARTRVAAQLPLVAPVLESATSPEGYCYISQALPEGTALSTLAAEGKQLTVEQACALISAAAELYAAAAEAGLAAAPLTADRVFMNRAGKFHFLSPVLGSPPAGDDTPRQLRGLADAIQPLRPTQVPGEGRMATLLLWMQEGYEGEALDWPAIASTAGIITEQLKPKNKLHVHRPQRYDKGREQRADKRRRREGRRRCLLVAAAIATVLAMGAGGLLLAPESVPPIPALRGGFVHCQEGDKLTRVAEQPVSLAEYRRYLEEYPALDAARRGSITQDIPPAECDPTPSEWEAQLATAQADAPVTNVSYWQALMYARYLRGSLPTATQLAAARAEAGLPGVEEWTQQELPAAHPYSKARLVLPAEAGASPIPESNPAAHSPKRGFRICP